MSDKPLIMIADNEPTNVGFLALEFESAGYQPVTVQSPDEARKEFIKLWNQDKPPKIVLLDVALGRETGWEIVKFIRRYDRDCLIFMFTGHKNPIVDKIQVRQTGANGIIYKPKDGAEVLAQIKLYEKNREKDGSADQGGFVVIQTAKEAAFIMVFLIAVALNIWFVARLEGNITSIKDDISLLKGQAIATDKAVSRIQGKNDAKLEEKK